MKRRAERSAVSFSKPRHAVSKPALDGDKIIQSKKIVYLSKKIRYLHLFSTANGLYDKHKISHKMII